MRKTTLAFLGVGFGIYWLLMMDPSSDQFLSLGPVKPSIVQIPNPPYDLEEPLHTEPLAPLFQTETPNLQQWLKTETILVGQTDPDPAQTLTRLRDKAALLKSKDLSSLKSHVMNRGAGADERFLAIYMLSLAGGAATEALKDVSFSRIVGLPSDRQHSDEVILRTQAIEALVQKLPLSEARALLRELLSQTSDPIIARHVQYWLGRLS